MRRAAVAHPACGAYLKIVKRDRSGCKTGWCARVRVSMEATWTPAAGAGSARFSTNLRDPTSYAEQPWAVRDRPWWMPEFAAKELFDRKNLSPAAAFSVLLTAIAIILLLIQQAVHLFISEYRWHRSNDVAQKLMKQEKADKKATAAATRGSAFTSNSSSERAAPSNPSGLPMARFCRLCDVRVDEEHAASHEAGKRHRKLKEAAGALGEGTCWVWRPVSDCMSGTQPDPEDAAAPGRAEDQAQPVEDRPRGIATSAGKGKGAWLEQPRRRR